MASKTELCNMALNHIGISILVNNIDTDTTKEAKTCRRWWDTALKFAIRYTDWNFTRYYIPLALLTGSVPSQWKYKYAYPVDCQMLRAITIPGQRVVHPDQRIPFEIATELVGAVVQKVVFTDQQEAEARCSRLITDTTLFDPMFDLAHSYFLASLIAVPLSVKPAIADAMRKAYFSISAQAEAMNYNESQDGPEPEEIDRIREEQ